MSSIPLHISFDAKRIVRNGTGLGACGRTLVNDLSHLPLQLSLYAPDKGHEKWRTQVLSAANVHFCYPDTPAFPCLQKMSGALWRSHGIVNDLKRDNIQLYHGLSGELPIGIRKSGIPSVVTIHDLIFLRHPEFYHPLDVQIYKWKFYRTLREASHIIAISECTKRDIIELGHVDDSRISLIYQSCAQRFGVCSEYVAPTDVTGMANAIRRSLCGADGRESRIQRSISYVQRFAGNDVASQVFELYHHILQY